ncbi:hypothetical protein EV385_2837 [Krasilnikovia cinnamomea]|uniref:Uncharacterized protein n=1 Tax=Krasilnikovia cinnamomea TaxID=349313 RepID=A0A4Q7ZLE4_9ACTN|nr:hypothetical protein [Krasilnikovia cinnamomea]RZU51039.1 hypothetical protein EV385_2837 [Krasilnikovia cinnamomea]
MSRQFRHLVAAMALGGLLLGAPLLTSENASAGQSADGHQGFALGEHTLELACRSTPDLEVVTVRAERVRAKELRTAHPGAGRGTHRAPIVTAHRATEAVFARTMRSPAEDPTCALTDESTPVVAPTTPQSAPPSTVPGPTPLPSGSPTVTETSPGQGVPSSSAGSSVPPTSTQTTRPQRPPTVPPRPPRPPAPRPVPVTTAPTTAVIAPAGGGGAQAQGNPTRRDTVAAAPVIAGLPPGGTRSLATAVTAVEAPPTSDAAPVTTSAGPAAVVNAEAAALPPVPEEAPIGLLALTALVCVCGVGFGAIRAIVAQRASRAMMA